MRAIVFPRYAGFLLAVCLCGQLSAQIQNADVYEIPGMEQQVYRYNINIPNLDGYETLKCDFHMHTVFSDGQVWPAMRVDEAWNDGLDAIAITDHIEFRRFRDFVGGDLNSSKSLARKRGEEIGLLVVDGTEVTRKKPLGHINALFVKDVTKLDQKDELAALDEAVKQGAYLFWNHPGWPDNHSTLYQVHKDLIARKKIRGVEVFNQAYISPKALDWCNEFGLAPFANSDLHVTSRQAYREKFQRPLTLVFVKAHTIDGLKEALFAGRTLACFANQLAGKEEYIKEIVRKSLSVKVIDAKKGVIEISNKSDLQYAIKFGDYQFPIPVLANQTLRIRLPSGTDVSFTNCLIGQNKFVVMKLW